MGHIGGNYRSEILEYAEMWPSAAVDMWNGFVAWAEGLKGGAAPMIGTIFGTLIGATFGNVLGAVLSGRNLRVAETRRFQLEARSLQNALEAELTVQMALLPEIAVTMWAFGTDPTPRSREQASTWSPQLLLEQSIFAANAGKIGALPPQSARALIEFHSHLRDLSRLVGLAADSAPQEDRMPVVFAMAKALRALQAGLLCWEGMSRRRSNEDRGHRAKIEKAIQDMSGFLSEVRDCRPAADGGSPPTPSASSTDNANSGG